MHGSSKAARSIEVDAPSVLTAARLIDNDGMGKWSSFVAGDSDITDPVTLRSMLTIIADCSFPWNHNQGHVSLAIKTAIEDGGCDRELVTIARKNERRIRLIEHMMSKHKQGDIIPRAHPLSAYTRIDAQWAGDWLPSDLHHYIGSNILSGGFYGFGTRRSGEHAINVTAFTSKAGIVGLASIRQATLDRIKNAAIQSDDIYAKEAMSACCGKIVSLEQSHIEHMIKRINSFRQGDKNDAAVRATRCEMGLFLYLTKHLPVDKRNHVYRTCSASTLIGDFDR